MPNDTLRKLDTNIIYNADFVNTIKGFTAGIIHHLLFLLLSIITIFSFDFKTLSIALVFLLLITFSNIITHNCPLTQIELEAYGDCLTDICSRYIPINYDCNRRYEVQLQYMVIATAAVMVKMSFLLIKNNLNEILKLGQ